MNDISLDDFQSIKRWWFSAVRHVEKPTPEWFGYVTSTENVVCYCLKLDGEIKSYCQADIAEERASVSIVSNPGSLRKGFAGELLKYLEEALKSRGVITMEAAVEAENHASHSLAVNYGFTKASISCSEPGFTDYYKRI